MTNVSYVNVSCYCEKASYNRKPTILIQSGAQLTNDTKHTGEPLYFEDILSRRLNVPTTYMKNPSNEPGFTKFDKVYGPKKIDLLI